MPYQDLKHPPLPKKQEAIYWKNLHGASLSLALSYVIKQSQYPILIVTDESLTSSRLLEELEFFGVEKNLLQHFPDWETLPYDHFSPHQDIISERLAVLSRFPMQSKGACITHLSTLMHYLSPKNYLDGHLFFLKEKEALNVDILKTRLINAGYHSVSQVRERGEFAIRGSIIDVYAMGCDTPFRIDLFDNEIDSIRIFSPENQRSLEKVSEIRLLPAKEFPLTEEAIDHFRHSFRTQFSGDPLRSPMYQDISEGIITPGLEYYLPLFFESTATLFDYLPNETCLITIGNINTKINEFWQEITARYEQGRYDISRPIMPPEQIFLTTKKTKGFLKNYSRIHINDEESFSSESIYYSFKTQSSPNLNINYKAKEPLSELKAYISNYKGRVLFCAETLGRREVLLQLFHSIDLRPHLLTSWQDFLTSQDQYAIVVALIDEGCVLENEAITLFAESQLFSQKIMQRRLRKKSNQDTDILIRDLTELQLDDPVVHIDHGVSRYRGLKTLQIGTQVAEFLCLEYQGNDKLYVPVSSLHLISRYSGNTDNAPINKLGTEQWQKTKRKAIEKIHDVAAELLDLYAKRASRPGDIYSLPEEQYATFASQFPFEETPDQLQAIESVFADMTSDKPMDRVICGDVGFGKTEVALRAAFLAAQNSKQVCLLVPTTLLAQQHFDTFQNRFADWPIQVEMLSRFRTGKEQEKILKRMEEGKVDIIIGTHKLLQSDIQFKSLGLIIIDEEHRFGVKQKEKLKSLRTSCDILTLTATPIPRTLNMALSGIRDLSIIATPPAKRLSVKTYVHEYQDQLIQEALQREIYRGGQVYFLHNDISTINKKAEEIAQLVPESRPIVAHGQMHERELERIMSQFYHRHYNVLICSTIIESGIDIPTANTIIINRADKLGLAQLHQLRGRVGRSHHQAYAYLFIPSRKLLSADAAKRLDAIASFDDLGIGFTLATHDLEIRGAGELLGEQQSGEMHAIGFTLYMDLLSRTIDTLKSGQTLPDEKTLFHRRSEIDLHITALIPEDYLGDVPLRLHFYNRIANAKLSVDLTDIQVEMIDRFGLMPTPLKSLIAIAELKLKADSLGIIKIDANKNGGKLDFNDKPNINPLTIIHLIQKESHQFRLDGPMSLRFNLKEHEPLDRITLVDEILEKLKNHVV